MTSAEHDRTQDVLGEYWDALNQGLTGSATAELDPAIAGTIRRLRTLDDARSPDPAFVTRLEQQLQGSSETALFDASAPVVILTGSANGYRGPQHLPRITTPEMRPRRPWMAPLATAAVVLLTLIGGFVAFGGPLRSGRLGQQLAMLPAFIASDEQPLAFMSEITGGDDPLEHPTGVAVSADGGVYVIDAARDQIRVFDANGTPRATWGERGTGPGQFGFSLDFLWGDLAFGPDGNLYVLDVNNARIQKFTPKGDFLLGWGELGSDDGQFLYPTGIGIDAEGRVYVADWGNHRVQVFDAEGVFLAAWNGTRGEGAPLAGPNDVTIDAAGTAWVSDEILQRLIAFAPDGTIVNTFGQIGDDPGDMRGPLGITNDTAGHLYIAEYDGDRVQVFAPDGTSLGIVGESGTAAGQFDSPSYLTLAPDGSLYVTDEGNHRIQKFTTRSSTTTPP